MAVAVRVTAAVRDQAVVQQCSIPFLDGLQFLQQKSKLLDVEAIDGS